ncbi:MAG: hypothetical protein IKP77_01860 [Acholeplasmatales bacterium]|nr:hypothetical protein [Acholeplasmatales bacterium]
MAFWSKKKLFDVLSKEFKNNNISIDVDDNKLSFEVNCSDAGYNLYPYIKLDENESIMTILINLRKIGKENIYERINSFNLISKYYTMKLKDSILYLEYNVKVDNDNIYSIVMNSIDSIKELQFEIEKV